MTKLTPPPQFTVSVDPQWPIVRVTRTQELYKSIDEVLVAHQTVGRILDEIGRTGRGLLVDLREGPLNNEPAFEQAVARGRPHVTRGFQRLAILVRTAVGALQTKRMIRDDGIQMPVFQDEATVIAYLTTQDSDDNPPPSRVSERRSRTPPLPVDPRGKPPRS